MCDPSGLKAAGSIDRRGRSESYLFSGRGVPDAGGVVYDAVTMRPIGAEGGGCTESSDRAGPQSLVRCQRSLARWCDRILR